MANSTPLFNNGPLGTWVSGNPGQSDTGSRLLIGPGGEIVLVGQTGASFGSVTGWKTWLFDQNGVPDAAFGAGGSVAVTQATPVILGGATLTVDGKLVLVGATLRPGTTNSYQFTVVRYADDGLDTGFDGDGVAFLQVNNAHDLAKSVSVASGGKLVVGGYSQAGSQASGTSRDFTLVRLDENGSLDTTFGTGGKVITPIGSGPTQENITTVKVLEDDSVLAVGTSINTTTGASEAVLLKYTATGVLDTSFDTDGMVRIPVADFSTLNSVASFVIQADGKIVIVGYEDADGVAGGPSDIYAIRLNADGSMDTGFADNGKFSLALGSHVDVAYKVVQVQDGGLVLAGLSFYSDERNHGYLLKLAADGTIDTSFGDNGIAWSPFQTAVDDGFGDVAVDANGNLVVAAFRGVDPVNPRMYDSVLLRYGADGTLDTSFGVATTVDAEVNTAEGAAPVVVDDDASIYDADLAALNNYAGATLTLERDGGLLASDTWGSTGTLTLDNGTARIGGIAVGAVENTGDGRIQVTFNGNATQERVNLVAQQLTWSNAGNAAGDVAVRWTFDDGQGASVQTTTTIHVLAVTQSGTAGNDSGAGAIAGTLGDDVIDALGGNDSVNGSEGNDLLIGNAGNDTLAGGLGDDTLVGGAGADSFTSDAGNDVLDGGVITDRTGFSDGNSANYAGSAAGIQVDFSGITGDGSQGVGLVQDGFGGIDRLHDINSLRGSEHDDTIIGSSAMLFEEFDGGAGNDIIDGGAVTDTLNNVDGNRVSYRFAGAGINANLATGVGLDGGGGVDRLINITQVRGSSFGDTITGSGRTDFVELFEGRGGADTIDGGGGFDIVRYDAAGLAGVTVNLVTGTASGADGEDVLSNIEGVYGSAGGDVLTGGNAANGVTISDGKSEVFRGNGGDDTIDGGQGYDRADYNNAATGVSVTLNGAQDGTASDGLGGTDTLRNIEGVRGSDHDDTLTGSAAAFESFEGRAGDDIIDGQGGTDRVDYFNATGGVNVDFGNGTAADGVGGTDSLANIENVRGTRDFDDTIAGSESANVLEGQGGNDQLAGAGGNDSLQGGIGNDTLEGGEGDDSLSGGAGDDSLDGGDGTNDWTFYGDAGGAVQVNLATGVVTGAGGNDTIANVENVSTGGANDAITGTDASNALRGEGGNDTILGGLGGDYITGGAGNDSIVGGDDGSRDWADYFYSDATAGVNVTLGTSGIGVNGSASGGNGNDTLQGIESVHATKFDDTLTGDGGSNDFQAEGGNDSIAGGAGSDWIDAGTGQDTVDGGADGDTLHLIGDLAAYTVISSGGDLLLVNAGTQENIRVRNVENFQFGDGWKSFDDVAAAAAPPDPLAGGPGNDSLPGGPGDDFISGGAGNDTLLGLDGNDTLRGGTGNDVLDGGSGSGDWASYSDVTTGMTVSLMTGRSDGGAGVDALANIENISGSAFNDTIAGDDGNNFLLGEAGNDRVLGNGGNDSIAGGAGNDSLDGGAGFDELNYDQVTTNIVVNLVQGRATGGAGTDTITGFETVVSGSGNDSITGDAADNTIVGNRGNDTLLGGAGWDTVAYWSATAGVTVNLLNGTASGADGADTISGFEAVVGSAFGDVITGNASDNDILGGAGDDTLDGGAGFDTAAYWDATAGVSVNLGTGAVSGAAGADQLANFEGLMGSRWDDTLTGSSADNNLIQGGAGNDLLDGGAGAHDQVAFWDATSGVYANLANGSVTGGSGLDTISGFEDLTGGGFNDTLVGDGNDNVINGGAGLDVLDGAGGTDLVAYWDAANGVAVDLAAGSASVAGTAGADTLQGFENVTGGSFNDTITGDGGDNGLRGESGNDVLNGGGGNDFLTGGSGNDTIDGGAGTNDTADYQYGTATAGVNVNLATGVVSGGEGADVLSNIENLQGSNFGDVVVGSGVANQIVAYGGNDSVSGGAGNDVLIGGEGNDTLSGENDNDFLDGGNGNDSLLGGDGADNLQGAAGNDTLLGGAGRDNFNGGAGDDSMDGGAITDRANYTDLNSASWASATAGVGINLQTGVVQDGLGGTDTVSNINFVTAGSGNDTITGSNFTNLFEQFDGGAGDDTIDGGAIDALQTNGNRVTYQGANSKVTVDLGAGTGSASGFGNDTLTNINNVTGGSAGDALTGSNSTVTEQFEGRAGNDTIDGLGGTDVVRYDSATTGVVVNLATGTASDGLGGTDELHNIEGVRGSNFNDQLTGGNAASDAIEVFTGNGGNDTITGGSGYDRADYNTATKGVTVTLTGGGEGTAAQDGLDGQDVLHGIEGLRGGAYDDSLTGSDDASETFEGREGNDAIDGNGGTDRIDYGGSLAGIVAALGASGGAGTVQDGTGGTDTVFDIEDVRGSSFNDVITGNELANRLEGGAGNDALNGGAGNDTLLAGTGADTVDGGADAGAGGDVLVLAGNYEDYLVSRTATDTILTRSGESVTVRNVETFQFANGTKTIAQVQGNATSDFADNFSGTEGDDTIDGKAGADSLQGLGGNDSIFGGVDNDTLVGGLGNDTLVGNAGVDSLLGGAGNDTYTLELQAQDAIVELGGEGIDSVNVVSTTAGATYTLGENLENAFAAPSTGTVTVNLAGNGLDNLLVGNNAVNTLTGNAGNDTLNGGLGNDILTGGTGNDVYVVNTNLDAVNEVANEGVDRVVVDFTAAGTYTLKVNVEHADIVGTLAVGVTGNDAANFITGNGANNVLNGGVGNDTLLGGAGNDSILGGVGSDLVQGNAGNDTLDGGVVTDRINYSDGNNLDYSDDIGAVDINLQTGKVIDGFGNTDTVSNFQFLFGSAFDDTILGTTGTGFELFEGLGGDDTIDGGAISDLRNGTDANRIAYTYATGGVQVDLSGSDGLGHGDQAVTGAAGNDVLHNFNQVRGSDFGDVLTGSGRTDTVETFEARGGDNTIHGGAGNDTVRYEGAFLVDGTTGVTVDLAAGTASGWWRTVTGAIVEGTDTFDGIEGVQGSRGNDLLTGGGTAGEFETFRGGAGNDTIDGKDGFDRIEFGSSTSGVTVNLGDGTVANDGLGGTDSVSNIEWVRGSDFADSIMGGTAEFEWFEGRAGNDTIDGGGGFADRADYVSSTAGVNVNLTNTFTTGGTASDGWGGTDTLRNISDVRGSSNNDTITGSSGRNYFEGLDGNDSIAGAAGNDTIVAGPGSDTVDGGADDGAGGDVLVMAGNADDWSMVRVDGTNTRLTSKADATQMVLFRGIETVHFDDGDRTMADLWGNTLDGFDNDYTDTDDAHALDGGVGNDTIRGMGGDDTINGGTGVDSLVGGLGDDTYLVDNVGDRLLEQAGEGTDSVNVAFTVAGTYVLAAEIENATVTATSTTLAIGITGNDSDNQLTGNGAANALSGGAGNDTIDGGAGVDNMSGGTGDDLFVVSIGTDVVTEAVDQGLDTVKTMFSAAGAYTLAQNVENAFVGNNVATGLTGNGLANELTGNSLANALAGGAGEDTLIGNGGNDTLDGGGAEIDRAVLSGNQSQYAITRPNATDFVFTKQGGGETVTMRNIDIVQFADGTKTMAELLGSTPSALNDTLTGTEGDNTIDGLAGNDIISGLGGNDTLVGGAGIDTLIGGAGDDVYRVDVATDRIDETAPGSDGIDRLEVVATVTGTYTLAENVEDGSILNTVGTVAIHLTGNAQDNHLTGNSAANILIGKEGNDTLNGLLGNDNMQGGAGDDTYVVNVVTDIVNETIGGSDGIDTVQVAYTAAGSYTLGAFVENGVITSTLNGVNLSGNSAGNSIFGGSGNNILAGGAGNDTLFGNGGNDTIDGDGAGATAATAGTADTLLLAGSAADYVVTRPSPTQTTFTRAGSTVTVTSIEFVQFGDDTPVALSSVIGNIGSTGNDTLEGGSGGDVLDGGAGNDTLSGFEGDDTLLGGAGNDSLVGGAGMDSLDGGAGNDVYAVGVGDGDDIIEQDDAAGFDVVRVVGEGLGPADVSFTRGYFSFDDLVVNVVTGSGDEQTVDHTVIVNFFNDDAVNEAGAIDEVQVGDFTYSRQDILAQALGADNGDVRVGYGSADTINGDAANNWVMAGAGNDTVNGGDGFDTVFGGTGADVLGGGTGSDTLVGGAGADQLAGGADNDLLVGGAGGDTYHWGFGMGWDTVSEALPGDLPAEVFDSGVGPVYVPGGGDVPVSGDIDTVRIEDVASSSVRAQRTGDDLRLTIADTSESLTITNYFVAGAGTVEKIVFDSGETWTQTMVKAKVLVASSGDDAITGYLAGDKLNGLGGNDVLDGREGNDTLNGGAGDDLLIGGAGMDRFVIDATGAGGVDTMADFTSGVDTIALSASYFSTLGTPGSRVAATGDLAYDEGTGALTYQGQVIAIIGTDTHPSLGGDFLLI